MILISAFRFNLIFILTLSELVIKETSDISIPRKSKIVIHRNGNVQQFSLFQQLFVETVSNKPPIGEKFVTPVDHRNPKGFAERLSIVLQNTPNRHSTNKHDYWPHFFLGLITNGFRSKSLCDDIGLKKLYLSTHTDTSIGKAGYSYVIKVGTVLENNGKQKVIARTFVIGEKPSTKKVSFSDYEIAEIVNRSFNESLKTLNIDAKILHIPLAVNGGVFQLSVENMQLSRTVTTINEINEERDEVFTRMIRDEDNDEYEFKSLMLEFLKSESESSAVSLLNYTLTSMEIFSKKFEKQFTKSSVIGFISGAFESYLTSNNDFIILNEQNSVFGQIDLVVSFPDSRPSLIFEISVNESTKSALERAKRKGLSVKWKSLSEKNVVFGVNCDTFIRKCNFSMETVRVKRPIGLFNVILGWLKLNASSVGIQKGLDLLKKSIRDELLTEYYSLGGQYKSSDFLKFVVGQFISSEFEGEKFYGMDSIKNSSYFVLLMNDKLIVLKIGNVFVPIEGFINQFNSEELLRKDVTLVEIVLKLFGSEKIDSNIFNEMEVNHFSIEEVSVRVNTPYDVDDGLILWVQNTTIDVNYFWEISDRKRLIFVESLNDVIDAFSEKDEHFIETSLHLKSFIHGLILGKRKNANERVIVNIDVTKSGFSTTDLEARRIILKNDGLFVELYGQLEIKVSNNGDELLSLFENAKLQMEKHKLNHEAYSFANRVNQQMFIWDNERKRVYNSFLEFQEVSTENEQIHFNEQCHDDENLFYLPCFLEENNKEKAVIKGAKILEKISKLAKDQRTDSISDKMEEILNFEKAKKLLKRADKIPLSAEAKTEGLKLEKSGFKYFKKSHKNFKMFKKIKHGATKALKPFKSVGKVVSKHGNSAISMARIVFKGARLVSNIIDLKDVDDESERNEKIAFVVVDGVTIVADTALLVMNIVNVASSVTGPVSLVISALTIVGTGIYKGVKRVNEIESQIGKLSVGYKIKEGLRGFFGFDVGDYIQYVIRERKLLDQIEAEKKKLQKMNYELAINHSSLLVEDVINFLIRNKEFDAKVVPLQQMRKLPMMNTGECERYKYHESGCCKTVWKVISFGVCFALCEKYYECVKYRIDRPAALWDNATIPEVVKDRNGFNRFTVTAQNQGGYDNEGKIIQNGDDFYKVMYNSIVLIDEIMNYVQTTNAFKQQKLTEGSSKLCYPFKTFSKYNNERSYYCKNAFGISYTLNRTQFTSTLIDLEDGNDFAVGRSIHSNTFIVRKGVKFMEGGQADDMFIFVGDQISGRFVGNGGDNTLNIQHYASKSDKVIIIQRNGPLNNEEVEPLTNIDIVNMTTIVGRSYKTDHLYCDCDVKKVMLGGGRLSAPDLVSIADPISSKLSLFANINRDCEYNLNVNVERNTRIKNYARNGNFVFIFPNLQNQLSLRDIHCDYWNQSAIEIILAFDYSFSDLKLFAANVEQYNSGKRFNFKLKFGGNDDIVTITEITGSNRKAQFFLRDKSNLMINDKLDLNYFWKSNLSDVVSLKRMALHLGFTLFTENDNQNEFFIFNAIRSKKCDKTVNIIANDSLKTVVAEKSASLTDCIINIYLKNFLDVHNYAEFGNFNYLISDDRLKAQNQTIFIHTPAITNHFRLNISFLDVQKLSVENTENRSREISFKIFENNFNVKQFTFATEEIDRLTFHFENNGLMNILDENVVYYYQKLNVSQNFIFESYLHISRRLNATLFIDDIKSGTFYVVNNYEDDNRNETLNLLIIRPSNFSSNFGCKDRNAVISLCDSKKLEIFTVSENFQISVGNDSSTMSEISIREMLLNTTTQHYITINLSFTDLSEIIDTIEVDGVYNHSKTVIKSTGTMGLIVHEYFHKQSKIQYMLNNGYVTRIDERLYSFSKIRDFSDSLLKLCSHLTMIIEVESSKKLLYINRQQQKKCKQSTTFWMTSANETTVTSNELSDINDLLCTKNIQVEFNEKLQLFNGDCDGYFIYKWTKNATVMNSNSFIVEIASLKDYASHNLYFDEAKHEQVVFKIMDTVSNITNTSFLIDENVVLIENSFKQKTLNFKLNLNLEFYVVNTAKFGQFNYFVDENNAKSHLSEFYIMYSNEVNTSNGKVNLENIDIENVTDYNSEVKNNSSIDEIVTLTFCSPQEDEYANHTFHFDFEVIDIESMDVQFESMKMETIFSFTSKANRNIIEKIISISFKRFNSANDGHLSYNNIVIYYKNDTVQSPAKFELTAYSKKENYVLFNISTNYNGDNLLFEATINDKFNIESVFKVLESRRSNTLDIDYFETSIDDKLTIALILYELSPLFADFPYLKLDPSIKVKITEETDTSFDCIRNNARFFFGKNSEFVRSGVDYHILQTLQENEVDMDVIIRDYSALANKLNAMMFMELQPSGDIVVVAQSSNSIIKNKPFAKTHLIGNNGENTFLILPREDNKTAEVIVYGYTRDDKQSDCIDIRILNVSESNIRLKQDTVDLIMDVTKDQRVISSIKLKDIFKKSWFAHLSVKFDEKNAKILHFNGDKKSETNHIVKRHVTKSVNECSNCSTSTSTEKEDTPPYNDDSENERESEWSLASKPIVFDSEESNVLLVSAENVAENTSIVVNENYEKFDFMRLNDSLVITNIFKIDMLYEASQLSYIIVKDYYKSEDLKTLEVSFSKDETDVKLNEVKEVPSFEEALRKLENDIYGSSSESVDFSYAIPIMLFLSFLSIILMALFIIVRRKRYGSYFLVNDIQLNSFNEKYSHNSCQSND